MTTFAEQTFARSQSTIRKNRKGNTMGHCGCADFNPILRMPGPDGFVYAIGVYPSCVSCDSPAGITITKIPLADVENCNVGTLPEIDFDFNLGEKLIPVLHPNVLMKKLVEFAIDNVKLYIDPDSPDYNVDGLIQDGIQEIFEEAVWGSQNND